MTCLKKKDASYFRGCEYDERWDDMEYCYVAYAYETCPWNHPDTYPLMFMQQMLGQWDKRYPGGRYHVNPLTAYFYGDDSRPITESYMAFNTPYTDTGLFGVYAVTHPYDLKYALEESRREVNRYGYDVNEAMLEDVRERLKATLLLSLGNTSQLMEDVGRQLLVHGRRIHPVEAIKRINDVDVNAVKVAAHRYLIDKVTSFFFVVCFF
ncbi:mitochondrial processing peptidase beta subunit [Reticulomyxa filosa]|uniref:Mitochondrial processing peptidase beta subunit n=1 Tax=Reticulomyxa filosa TaxID=46433 RepID=X6NZP6_RETFI|nr:mitochondrial processing peptidase beta subunit [Reticulomyxa filosa]|eukprot:ETO30772.1 mitochondrial processing peptidase beta subunit [Reticulomyxa filosa]